MNTSKETPQAVQRTSGDPAGTEVNIPVSIPMLASGRQLDIEQLRDEHENTYLRVLWFVNVITVGVIALIGYFSPATLGVIGFYGLSIAAIAWISWKLTFAFMYGHGIEVGPNQYPQIYAVVKQASDILDVPIPTILVLQGHGLFELMVAKRFTRRGLIIITSNMLDEFCQRPSSREFMMFIGRQLGHIKAGHFRFWFFKDVLGLVSGPVRAAYWRRCHFTADRIGLVVAGNLRAAEQALCIITVGARIAPGTNVAEVFEQRTKLFESFWAWLRLGLSTYRYIIDRITRLHQLALEMHSQPIRDVGALPIHHASLRTIPLLVIHGHDRLALLELKDYLRSSFPNVALRVMVSETIGSVSLPEKFESVAGDVLGAIAVVTPDDVVGQHEQLQDRQQFRARQNVVIEIGWIWGRLGRRRCLLLVRGTVEMPSDLSGVDTVEFKQTPAECNEAVRRFIEVIERESQLASV